MKTILLATKYFPYSKSSEVFLLNEIYSLPNNVKLIIMPESSVKSEFIDSNLHNLSNVEILKPIMSGKMTFLQKVYNSISSITSTFFWIELYAILKKKRLICKRIKKMLYALMTSRYYYKKTLQHMKHVDIIYSYWINYYVLALIKVAKKRDIKIVSRVHGHDLYDEVTSYNYHPFRKYILSKLDYCLPISLVGKDYLESRYRANYKLFRLGTKSVGINPENKDNSSYHFVSCSSVIPVKRVDLIYKVLTAISNRHIIWTHFGGGADFLALRELTTHNRNNLDINLMGHVDSEGLFDFFSTTHTDCFINLSTSEGIPVSIMEACSFGIPIIATNVGGVKELVFNNINGLLIDDIYSEESIINEIRKFIQLDDEIILNMRRNSRKIWNDNYNAEMNYHSFYEFLDSIT